jgi:polyphenol oxidase
MKPVTALSLAALPNIAHGFFTRHGGVSRGIYTSLNCGNGSGDDATAVRENRRRVADFLTARDVVTVHQIHSATAVVAEQAWDAQVRPRADAIVTRQRGLALGVLSADCAPVLLADAEAGVVGAAHAGWRGAIGGVVEATIAAMEGLGAKRAHMHGAVGPCIGQSAYEVGFDFEEAFLARDSGSARFFARPMEGGRPHFDLAGYVASRLERAGIAAHGASMVCTFAQADDFFSFRRMQAKNEPDYGRQIAAIVLT